MRIVHIASELAPIAKIGGLGDVLHGLSKELNRTGHTVEIILPKYDCLRFEDLKNLKVEFRELWIAEGITEGESDSRQRYNNTVWSATVDDLKVILIEPHHPQYYFSRGVIYGCHDDIDRFAYFSRVAMEYLFTSGKTVDVIHAHDWPTALIPVLYKDMYLPQGYIVSGGTVLTIHNMEHQGKCQPFNLSRVGLHGERYLLPEKMQDPYSPALINLLKGGIVYADHITTVSPTYEKEIQTVEGGFGLQETLVKQRTKLTGILNGIDENYWNPAKDCHLVTQYTTHRVHTKEDIEGVLKAKAENKRQLRTHLNLKEENKPLIASVTRLVPQKSPQLIKHALLHSLEKHAQFVLLGSSAPPAILQEFEIMQAKMQSSDQARILLDRDEALAHLLFAAADMFIIPSLFEPCGLTQLIALRYGTIPIARSTGGLSDTIFDIDSSTRPVNERNGFTFDFADTKGVNWALNRALECYAKDHKKWQMLLLNGMAMDFSWKRAVKKYVEIYERLTHTKESISVACIALDSGFTAQVQRT